MPSTGQFDDYWFDWFAADADGHVAALNTGGSRVVPEPLSSLNWSELHSLGNEAWRLSRSDGSLKGRGIPLDGLWEVGFFVYELRSPVPDPLFSGWYELARSPAVPIHISQLAPAVVANLRPFSLKGIRFAKDRLITGAMLTSEGILLVRDE